MAVIVSLVLSIFLLSVVTFFTNQYLDSQRYMAHNGVFLIKELREKRLTKVKYMKRCIFWCRVRNVQLFLLALAVLFLAVFVVRPYVL
jgi:hypothetical protein